MARSDKFLVLFYCVSAGLNGAELGTDEEEIVFLVYWVIDLHSNQVVSRHEYPVKPHSADVNENDVSDEENAENNQKSANFLGDVLHQFDNDVATKILGGGDNFTLITDGQLHLRQCLFPEAQRKGLLPLPSYYYSFHDLRKEFAAAHTNSTAATVQEILNYLDIESTVAGRAGLEDVDHMAMIILKLLNDGFHLHDPDIVQDRIENCIRTSNDIVDSSCCIKARGLPWQATDQDIANFFVGLNIAKGGVAMCLSNQGRRNGEALILFENAAHREMATKRHKHHIGNRYIEVYKATGEDFIAVVGGSNKEAQMFLSHGAEVIIRMRGLPYNATAKEIIDFFASGENNCKVHEDDGGILFVRKPDGRATGDAFVLFTDEADGQKALSKHKDVMGTRYIELFRSTTAEVQQVLNRTMENNNSSKSNNHLNTNQPQAQHTTVPRDLLPLPLINTLPLQMPLPSPQTILAGGVKDCLRMRGLPFECEVEHILSFLGDHSKNIVEQGVHMVVNAQGQPSGEVFIQMRSERDAFVAAQQKHHQNMSFGKKQRYVEVFQCSSDEMSQLLSGALPMAPPGQSTPMAALAAAAAAAQGVKTTNPPGLIAPGMLHPSSLPATSMAGLDQHLAGQLQNSIHYFTTQNLAGSLAHLPGFQGLRLPQNIPSVRQAFQPDTLWGLATGNTNPGLMNFPLSNPGNQGVLAAQAALLSPSLGFNPFLLQSSGLRFPPPPPPPVSTASSSINLTPQNAALLQSQLAAQRILLQHQAAQSIGIGSPPPLVALPPHSLFQNTPTTSHMQALYTQAQSSLGGSPGGVNGKRSYDQAFVSPNIANKRMNFGMGVLDVPPTISAPPTAYFSPSNGAS